MSVSDFSRSVAAIARKLPLTNSRQEKGDSDLNATFASPARSLRMTQALVTTLQYYGAAAGVIAALVISLDLGRAPTGWAFILFVTSSAALILWGFLKSDSEGIAVQNILLLAINLVGVYRYLIRKKAV